MKNKIKLKRYILVNILVITLFCLFMFYINKIEYDKYKKNYNNKINGIIELVESKYKDINKNEIISILNGSSNNSDYLKVYGIDINSDSIILENENYYRKNIFINIISIIIFSFSLLIIYLIYNYRKNKSLKEITDYIKEINKKNYMLDISSNDEDELSILKNELYKITVILKEESINALEDKINLKNSLEDISHQLKTPLTSINILLDNLIENKDMDDQIRNKFIKDIKREIKNINHLVLNILKLSKFDSNTIEFNRKEENLNDIVLKSIKNVETLSDLKNIKINYNSSDIYINCDYTWEVEAITNIIKNAIEHSNNKDIDIILEDKKIYKLLTIRDYGLGIKEKDLKNIFKRFYKISNNSDSFGIGLNLSKTIIEKDNGVINVESKENEGTTFIIKYFNI